MEFREQVTRGGIIPGVMTATSEAFIPRWGRVLDAQEQ